MPTFAENFLQGYRIGQQKKQAQERFELEQQEAELRRQQVLAAMGIAEQKAGFDQLAAQREQLAFQLELAKGQDAPQEQLPPGVAGPPQPFSKPSFNVPGAPGMTVQPTYRNELEGRALVLDALKRRGETEQNVEEERLKRQLPPSETVKYQEQQDTERARIQALNRPEPGQYVAMQTPDGKVIFYNAKTGTLKEGPEGATRAGLVLPDTTQKDLTFRKTSLQSLEKVTAQIKALQSDTTFGPIYGRVKNVAIEKLGGAGASPEEQELAIRMRALVRDQAFAEGGKQLTPTEKEEFTATLPRLTDTVQLALIKAEAAREILARAARNRVLALSGQQRTLVDPELKAMLGVDQEYEDLGEIAPGVKVRRRKK